MELKVHIPFQQLLALVRKLSPAQKATLRRELAEDKATASSKADFIELLLKGPVYSEKDIQQIESNRASIAAWRDEA